ncbi:MAG TPA: acyl-CoA ligase (AMP-forming), exosortase A system-associated [Chromatiales bacterium]|nr:acyl-CoA ligase (AMP-forming), exosortase A system-associated [Chromatiales bacterium]
MAHLIHHLVSRQAFLAPSAAALLQRDRAWDYAELARQIEDLARGLRGLGILPGERVAIWLPKTLEGVALLLAISRMGGVLVPINPLLKPAQVTHILADSGARALITQGARLGTLGTHIPALHDLRWTVCVDALPAGTHAERGVTVDALRGMNARLPDEQGRTEHDLAALLYTSGSTGQPKGVALSHRNLLAGAASVAGYLGIRPDDRLLAVLPLSFDYGLSQLTIAFHAGASCILLDYLLPRDLLKAITSHGATVLAGVPTLWHQLASQDWLPELASLRVLTNSGGRLPRPVIDRLRDALPQAELYLMYGLTEAFRSTYLPPVELDRRPDSIGKAIPNAEVRVLHPDGTPCAPHEPGELVHRGPTVALGYWNDPERTAERYRPLPQAATGLPHPELAVWSGDRVRMDEEGFLYFIGRDDDMLKTSGYRVSPTEIEDVLYGSGLVREAAAIGVEDDILGQRIVVVVVPEEEHLVPDRLLQHCRANLPIYMHPAAIEIVSALPVTPNGKVDRRRLREQFGAAPGTHMEPV